MGPTIHRKNKSHQTQTLTALVLSIWAVPSLALDLGRLNILSGMGEPLRAEVEIAQALPNELSSLKVQLAAPSTFSDAGMEFNPALEGVTATLQTRSNGEPFIALVGSAAVRENFIDLILETQWATGRSVKNYALLLNSVSDRPAAPAAPAVEANFPADVQTNNWRQIGQATVAQTPPAQLIQRMPTAQSNPLPDAAQGASVTLNDQNVPVYRFAPIDNAPSTTPTRNTASAAPTAAPRSNLSAPAVAGRPTSARPAANDREARLQVSPGDTASQLAMPYLASNVSMDQMLLAMLKANPNAFIQGNVNLVKAGVSLRMPSTEEALQIPRAQARSIVLAQTRDFAEYARRLAQSTLLVDGRNSREMSGKVGVERAQERINATAQDKLTLSKSSVQNDGSEAALAAEREAKDADEQLAQLNKNLQELEALVNGQPEPTSLASTGVASAPAGTAASRAAVNAEPETTAPEKRGNTTASWLQNLQDNKQLWSWAAAFLALILLLVYWARRKSGDPEPSYAPSYDDIPSTSTDPVMDHATANSAIPAQMSAIDLNLQTPTETTSTGPVASAATAAPQSYAAPSTMAQSIVQPVIQPIAQAASVANPGNAEDTEQSKLNLAAQLLAKGDKDLARALILSVISSSTGELKVKAIQLLGQIR